MHEGIYSLNKHVVGSHMRKVGSTGESKEGKVKDDVRMQETLKKKRHQVFPEN